MTTIDNQHKLKAFTLGRIEAAVRYNLPIDAADDLEERINKILEEHEEDKERINNE